MRMRVLSSIAYLLKLDKVEPPYFGSKKESIPSSAFTLVPWVTKR